ncbi:diguanylate cyclase domain-containing protein [Stappia sp. ES.058]|uniref:diguanylate cyclase domain-containing protein n=1 Tax=Stappia sp. ES.058 TaxID=1881061 RepID=UPI00087A37F5|nr:diguanylate cyclase [Stappia sp. ES.058]SDU14813.1 diguanylate cyclase (GGDEF) domain-containing protein [Stappia sp. ES.058]
MARWMKMRESNIAVGIYLICAAVVIAFAVSNAHVLTRAGGIADEVRAGDERNLVRNEVSRQIEILARDQSQISHWDEAVRALISRIDWEFVREEMADWLWDDFGIQTTIVIGPDDVPRVMVFEDDIRTVTEAQRHVDLAFDLIADARDAYMAKRLPHGERYTILGHPVRSKTPIYVSDFRLIDGEVNMIVAQAIVPDDEETLPEGLPNVLLTLKPLTPAMIAEAGKKLGIQDVAVVPAREVPAGAGSLRMSREEDANALYAIWTPGRPSTVVWAQALPVLAGVVALAMLALGAVALLYGRALRRMQKSEARNRFLAHHDALTGLPNRLYFDRVLEEILSRGEQDRCAVLCIDLDRFKAVNDTFGHSAGDTVLRTVASRILATVKGRGIAARVGGDEFIVLLHEGLGRDAVRLLCDGIVERICAEIPIEGGRTAVGASIGVAWWPEDAKTAKSIIRSADEALYRAKEDGRGRACLSDDPGADGQDREHADPGERIAARVAPHTPR